MQSRNDTRASRPGRHARRRPEEFVAAVRFRDGRRELFSVKNASDAADARRAVLDEFPDVSAVVVASRRH